MINNTKTNSVLQFIILFAFTFVSAITFILLLTDTNIPEYYAFLFLLPLSFAILSWVFFDIYFLIPSNIGISIIVTLFFIRMVLSPLFLYLGDYPVVITYSIHSTMTYSILLICYESFLVYFALFWNVFNKKNNELVATKITQKINFKYTLFVFLILFLIILMLSITPEFFNSYRSIFQLNDDYFVNFEDAQATAKYGTTFITKFAMVTGFYLMRLAIVLFPAFIIVFLSQREHTVINRMLSFAICLVPLFFISGSIATSLIYMLCLIFLRIYLYPSKQSNTRIILVLTIGGCAAIGWWIFRAYANDTNPIDLFSKNLMTYFSGANIVSGVFNLPKDFSYRVTYFLYDYLDSIPYGSTIFNLSSEPIQSFFNYYNGTNGQIPTTIGMGYYYFGPILSPLYSILFACISYNSARKILISSNPFTRLRLLLTTISFSMGIVMYNIEITFTTLFSLILPMYIIERIAFKNEQHT